GARPVLQGREERDGQVEQVHRFVVVLVPGWVEPEELEDGLVDPVDDETRDDRRQRVSGDEERDDEPRRDDQDEDDGGLGRQWLASWTGGDRDMARAEPAGVTLVEQPAARRYATRGWSSENAQARLSSQWAPWCADSGEILPAVALVTD